MPSSDHAYPWAHFKAPRQLVGSLSPFLLAITFRSLRCAAPLNVICFVPAMGIIPSDLRLFPFPVCEVIHVAAVMHYQLCKQSVCVLWLDPLTQARSVNGKDFYFSGFRPVWDLLSVHHRPQGLHTTSVNLSLLSMLYASFLWWSSLFLPAVHCELWLFNHS